MPRYPDQSASARAIRASVFARLAEGLGKPGIVPLHIGDTHLPPPETARWERRPLGGEAVYKYGEPPGLRALREAVAEDFVRRGLPGVDGGDVVIHAGATHALACACRSLLEPGDEVLGPAPEGAAYLFARIGDDAYPFLARALDAGVALAPGDGFGEAFGGWFRLCFTAVPEPDLARALDRIAPLLVTRSS